MRKSLRGLPLRAAVAAVYGFLLLPILLALVMAFNDADNLVFPPRGLSVRWFVAFFADRDFVASLATSLILAVLAAVAATVLGTTAAFAVVRYRFSGRALAQLWLTSPLYVPRMLVGMAMLLGFAVLGGAGALQTLVAAHVVVVLPYVVRSVSVSLYRMDRSVEEAARCLGATPAQTLIKVVLPTIRSGLFAGALFAFVISFTDLYLAIFLTGPSTVTLPLRMFTYLEWNSDPLPAAIAAVQIAIVLVVCYAAEKVIGAGQVVRF